MNNAFQVKRKDENIKALQARIKELKGKIEGGASKDDLKPLIQDAESQADAAAAPMALEGQQQPLTGM